MALFTFERARGFVDVKIHVAFELLTGGQQLCFVKLKEIENETEKTLFDK